MQPQPQVVVVMLQLQLSVQQQPEPFWQNRSRRMIHQQLLFEQVVVQPQLSYRAMLRERYHAAVCNGFNYARAEEGTADPCLQRILERFSAENYAAADRLLRLLMQAQ